MSRQHAGQVTCEPGYVTVQGVWYQRTIHNYHNQLAQERPMADQEAAELREQGALGELHNIFVYEPQAEMHLNGLDRELQELPGADAPGNWLHLPPRNEALLGMAAGQGIHPGALLGVHGNPGMEVENPIYVPDNGETADDPIDVDAEEDVPDDGD
jgi:hypothetical protein